MYSVYSNEHLQFAVISYYTRMGKPFFVNFLWIPLFDFSVGRDYLIDIHGPLQNAAISNRSI